MTGQKATSSIARQINLNFWGRQLFVFLCMDLLLLFLVCITFFQFQEQKIPQNDEVQRRYIDNYQDFSKMDYVIETKDGMVYTYRIREYVNVLVKPAIVIGIFELLVLIGNLFKTRQIRRIMRPLQDVARKAEELSKLAGSQDKFLNLEHAISNIKPTEPGAKLVTDDKELQSLEVAINNLLERMRESYRQQNRFVSDASHELRTPIAVIQGYVNMLDRWGKEDESVLNESIEALKNESQRMKELVEQLLFLARGDSGRNTLKKEDFSLTELAREVYEEAMMIDETHTYVFRGEEEITMNGDVTMIKQSMRIFMDNAAKYSKEGTTISLTVRRKGNHICYQVQDEGAGMAEQDIVHVFERFYRSDSARNSKNGGTGLGLSIAKWIVDAHGGNIEVLSRLEFGTRFTVIF